MELFVRRIVLDLDYFLLVFIRAASLLISSPVFGRRNIPNIAKISYCLAIAVVLFMGFPKTEPLPYTNLLTYAVMLLSELMLGMALGYVTTLFFTLVFSSGQIIDMQMGFGMVNVFDVQSNGNIPVTGNLLNLMMLIVFFTVNGHHRLITILYILMTNVPIGQITISPRVGLAAAEAFSMAFLLGINVAMPLIASGILGEVGLGLIVRTVPQMNVFVVGIPIKIAMGFLMLIFVLPVYVTYCSVIFDQMFISIESVFRSLMSAP